MFEIIFFTIMYIFFIIYELIPLYKEKNYKVFGTYTFILSCAYIMQIFYLLNYSVKDLYVVLDKLKYIF